MLILHRIRTVGALAGLPHKRIVAATFALAALGFGGCAQSPQQLAVASHGKEYFPSSIYGSASRRVIADGQPIPRGGGQYLVGKPYKVAGQTYYPSERKIVQVGMASWYGDAFHGRLTANGEIYDRNSFTAAHPTMPLPSYARVTNLKNNYSMIVRVNDRGPYASNRIMDVSGGVAQALDFKRSGTAKIKVEYVGRASLAGSDDAKLYATLRQDGPAHLPGGDAPSMMAEAETPRAEVASLAPYAPQPIAVPKTFETRTFETRNFETRTFETPRSFEAPKHVEAPRHVEALRHLEVPHHAGRQASLVPMPHEAIRHHGANEVDAAAELAAEARAARFARTQMTRGPKERIRMAANAGPLLPPSRPMDLGTIPGAASLIGHHHPIGLRMARGHDDD